MSAAEPVMVGSGWGGRLAGSAAAAGGVCARTRCGVSAPRGRPSPCFPLRQDEPRGSGGWSSAYGQCLKSVRHSIHHGEVDTRTNRGGSRGQGDGASKGSHFTARSLARGQTSPPGNCTESFRPCNYLERRLEFCHKASHPPQPAGGNYKERGGCGVDEVRRRRTARAAGRNRRFPQGSMRSFVARCGREPSRTENVPARERPGRPRGRSGWQRLPHFFQEALREAGRARGGPGPQAPVAVAPPAPFPEFQRQTPGLTGCRRGAGRARRSSGTLPWDGRPHGCGASLCGGGGEGCCCGCCCGGGWAWAWGC